jgi:pyridoxine 5-phosphate synthase
VNIDHVATMRQIRKATNPDPVAAAAICESAGVAGITIHLREDRRHIQDHDLVRLRRSVRTFLNLEMAATEEMIRIALEHRPNQVTLVPEKREEITTEGGLDVVANEKAVGRAVDMLQPSGIPVSLFVDPLAEQVEAAARTGARLVELHTGRYCDAASEVDQERELAALVEQAAHAQSLGLIVNAGHGLSYTNVVPVAAIGGMNELNIGYSIVCRAVIVGMEKAVRDMLDLVAKGSAQSPPVAR